METIPERKPKKKSRKPIYFLFGSILFFCIFIYLMTRPSIENLALNDLKKVEALTEIKTVWERYPELMENKNFLNKVREKLTTLNLKVEDANWFPKAPESINLIVIPDLSRRIIDSVNNPNQISNDKIILETIWNSFKEFSKFKMNTKDELTIDVTDIDQAKGQFGVVASQLHFDLSKHKKDNSNRLYFTESKTKQFKSNIDKMYSLAKEKPLGADYRFYLRRYLKEHLKKSDFYHTYLNKVIIITDGYLESENKPADTKIYGYGNKKNDLRSVLYPAVERNDLENVMAQLNLNIPAVDIDLTNVEFLICEVNERKIIEGDTKKNIYIEGGKGKDFDILKAYWIPWLKSMNAKIEEEYFIERQQNIQKTIEKIVNFINPVKR